MEILTDKTVYYFPTESSLDYFLRLNGHMILDAGMMREIYRRNRNQIAYSFYRNADGVITWGWSRVAWYRENLYKVITYTGKQRSE